MEKDRKRVFKEKINLLSKRENYYPLDSNAYLKIFSFLSIILLIASLTLYFLEIFKSDIAFIAIVFSLYVALFTSTTVRSSHSINLSQEDDFILVKVPLWFRLPEISLLLSIVFSLYLIFIE